MNTATSMSRVSTQLGWSRNLDLRHLLFLKATIGNSFYPDYYSIGLVTSNLEHSTVQYQRATIFEIMKTRVVFFKRRVIFLKLELKSYPTCFIIVVNIILLVSLGALKIR